MKRRDLIKTGLGTSIALGASASLPAKVFAQPMAGSARDRQLFEIAKREIDKAGDVLWHRDVAAIADFGVHSAEKRFHFVNLDRQEVKSFHVSHGTGSDPEHDGWLNVFSNQEGSHATSRGAYLTNNWYTGRFGVSMRLIGLDPTNSLALPRAIVAHRADYAEASHVERWGRLGRSNGCFAMGEEQFKLALVTIGGGRLLYADALGIMPDGSKVLPPRNIFAEPENGYNVLRPARQETFEQTNPGVF